jgi:rubrerythrin
MSNTIHGASVWEQEVYDHLCSHVDNELEVLQAYERLASTTESEAFRYLAKLILDDERRHHEFLRNLADTVRISAELTREPAPIPFIDFSADREEILAATDRFLAVEKEDDREIRRLSKELRDVRDTTLWVLVLDLIRADNEKHRRILEFIHERAKER